MSIASTLTSRIPKEDRVRRQTQSEINRQIDRELEQRLRFYAVQDYQTISERLAELDREWDIERALEANAASIGVLSLFLGVTSSKKWFLLTGIVSGFLLQHAFQGWCPPLPVLRKMGVRTRLEIEQERYALKILRGDFDRVLKRDEKFDIVDFVRGLREDAV